MVRQGTIDDYYYLKNVSTLAGISQKNAEYLGNWITRERAAGLSLNTINTNIAKTASWIRDMNTNDAAAVTTQDVLRAYTNRLDKISKGEYANATLDADVIVLRKFITWLHSNDASIGKTIVPLQRKKHHNTQTLNKYVNKEQILKMLDYARAQDDVRGVAIIMLLFGTGCRLEELQRVNISDVKIGRTNAIITLSGKTGRRHTPFIVSLPELQAWINCHPGRTPDGKIDPDAPLFVTYRTRGRDNTRLSAKRIGWYVRSVASAVGVPGHVRAVPHATRHLSVTENTLGDLPEQK